MVDIFEKEGISLETTNQDGIPKVSASDLQDPSVAASQPKAMPEKIPLPELQPVDGDKPMVVEVRPNPQPTAKRDIFAAEDIKPAGVENLNNAAFNNVVDLDNPQTPEAQKIKVEVDQDKTQLMELAKTRYTPDQIEGFQNNPIGFLDAMRMLTYKDVLPGGGAVQAIEAGQIMHIGKKIEKQEELSVGDIQLLNQYVDSETEKGLRGFSWGGKMGYYLPQIPAFAIEFAATGGIGKAAQTAALKGAQKVAVKGALAKAVGFTANATARAAAMPLQYAPTYMERRMNDYAAITDKGELWTRESTESPAVSALKAYGYTLADVVGQEVAPFIGSALVKPVTGMLKTPIASAATRLPAALQTALYDAYKVIQPSAQMSKAFSAFGWHGMLEQLGANRVTEIMNATIDAGGAAIDGQEYTVDQYLDAITPDKEQLLLEAGMISIAGGVHASADIAFNLMTRKGVPADKAHENIKNMSSIEREQFVNDNLPTPKSSYPKAPELMVADGVPVADRMSDPTVEEIQSAEPAHYDYEGSLTRSQLDSAEKVEPPPIDDKESFWNYTYREFFNDKEGVERVERAAKKRGAKLRGIESPTNLLSLHNQVTSIVDTHTNFGTIAWDADGNVKITGKSLKAVADDFSNMMMDIEPNWKARKQDFEDFLLARHYLHTKENIPDVMVSNEQFVKSVADTARISEKYKKKMNHFETLAQEVYDYQNRTRDLLVGNLLSPEQRAAEMERYPYYVPLNRVLPEKDYEAGVRSGDFVKLSPYNLNKGLEGSDLDVKDIFGSMMRNSARIIDYVSRARINKSIDALKAFTPENIQDVTLNLVPVKGGFATFKITEDPVLRDKLKATIETLGGTFEEMEKMPKVPGMRNIRGSYSPLEKTVRLRLGAPESTLAHEVGHMLDYKFGLKDKLLSDETIKAELEKLAESRLNVDVDMVHDQKGRRFVERVQAGQGDKYRQYIKSDREILANFFDAYVNSPKLIDEMAPKAKAAFEKFIDGDKDLAFIKDIKPSTARRDREIKKQAFKLQDPPKNTIPVMENGQRRYIQVSEPMFKSLQDLRPAELSAAEKILLAPFRLSATILRTGATTTPEFIVRNVVKDVEEAVIQSGVGYNPLQIPKAMAALATQNDDYVRWAAAGGKFGSFMALDDVSMQKATKELFRPGGRMRQFLRRVARNPLNLIHEPAQFGEQSTRLGVFQAAKKQGKSDVEAAQAALDATLNFPRGGRLTKRGNRYIPFLNVGFQAADKFVRAFKDNPGVMTFRSVATLTVPAILSASYYLYYADDKKRQEWLERPDWQKSMGIFFEVDGETHYIPVPYTLGYIFAGVPQLAMQDVYKGEKPEDGKNLALKVAAGFAGSLSPLNDPSAAIPPILKAAYQSVSNYDLYRGKAIFPKYLENPQVANEDKTNAYDSQTSKLLGKELDLSPALIDNAVGTQFGGAGRYVMDAGDTVINQVRKWNGEEVPEQPLTSADVPLIKGFTQRDPSGRRSNSYQLFEGRLNEAKGKASHYKKLDGPEREKYFNDNSLEIQAAPVLAKYEKQIKAASKQIGRVYDDKNMSSDQKVESIRQLEDSITKIARDANLYYSGVKEKK